MNSNKRLRTFRRFQNAFGRAPIDIAHQHGWQSQGMISDASKVLKFVTVLRGFTWWTLLVLTNVVSFYSLKQIEGSSSNFKIRAKKWTFGPLQLRRASFTKSNLAHSSSILARSPLNLPPYSLCIISVS